MRIDGKRWTMDDRQLLAQIPLVQVARPETQWLQVSRLVGTIKLLVLLLFTFFQVNSASTQTILTEDAFFQQIKANNPLARAAALRPTMADAQLMAARGAFDPKFFGGFNNKTFDGSNYYGLLDGGLKMRLPFGPEIKAGYERANGINVNPETSVPTNGLMYGGVDLPLLRNLMFDNNRAALRIAKIQQENATVEQRAILNNMMFEAGYEYWNWFRAWHQRDIQLEGLDLADLLLNATRSAFEYGDKPAIDTLEAGTNRQAREQARQAADLELQSASLMLSAFLFGEISQTEQGIAEQPIPLESIDFQEVVSVLSLSLDNPDIRMTQNKIRMLEVERRAKREQLKPNLNLKFNPLYAPSYDSKNPAVFDNFKWGLTAGTSLLLRKERAGVALADLKIQDAQFQLQQKQRSVDAKAQMYRQQIGLYQAQVRTLQTMTQQYLALVEAEQELFENGESSIFLVNYRQSAYLLAKSKLVDVLTKYGQSVLGLRYVLGDLG